MQIYANLGYTGGIISICEQPQLSVPHQCHSGLLLGWLTDQFQPSSSQDVLKYWTHPLMVKGYVFLVVARLSTSSTTPCRPGSRTKRRKASRMVSKQARIICLVHAGGPKRCYEALCAISGGTSSMSGMCFMV